MFPIFEEAQVFFFYKKFDKCPLFCYNINIAYFIFEVNIMRNNESTENYLKTILILSKRKDCVRSIDIAHELSFSKPSVSVAMKAFREKKYIDIDEDGRITLTDLGTKLAENIFERHQIIAAALMALGVDEETAYEDSCRIEHDICEKSFAKIKDHFEKHKTPTSRSGDIDVVLL